MQARRTSPWNAARDVAIRVYRRVLDIVCRLSVHLPGKSSPLMLVAGGVGTRRGSLFPRRSLCGFLSGEGPYGP